MDNLSTYSRKQILTWIKSLPYSQNLNDGVLFCKVLQKFYPTSFPRLNQFPKNQYEFNNNFKILCKFLEKAGYQSTIDLNKLHPNTKDYFEFLNWLRNFYEKQGGTNNLESNRNTIVSEDQGRSKTINQTNQKLQLLSVYQPLKVNLKTEVDTKNNNQEEQDINYLMQLEAKEDDIENIKKTLEDIKKIIKQSENLEELKSLIKKRVFTI